MILALRNLRCTRENILYCGRYHSKLPEISSSYVEAGLGEMPVAIIQHATLPQQKQVICSAENIEFAAKQAGLSYPAIIIIGRVVEARTSCLETILTAHPGKQNTGHMIHKTV